MRVNWRRRAQALNFIDRHLPGAHQFNGGGPLLPHVRTPPTLCQDQGSIIKASNQGTTP